MADIAKHCPQAKEFLTAKFADNKAIKEILENYKQKVEKEFFPTRGFGRLNLKEAKKAISDFKKLTSDPLLTIDIMLFYVENCVSFTAEFGDINESFYIGAENMFEQVVKAVNTAGQSVYEHFSDRLVWVAGNACDGWGFRESIYDIFLQLLWVDEEED